jgi:hypothetical protein
MFAPTINPPPKRWAKSGEIVTNESKNRNISRLSVIQKLVLTAKVKDLAGLAAFFQGFAFFIFEIVIILQ